MTITLTDEANRRTEKRVRRHGYDYDIILEHFIDDEPSPFGVLVKSHKTGRYTWFDRKTIICYESEPRSYVPVSTLIDGIKTYTPDRELLCGYFDHLMTNVLSKRDRKRFGPIYERAEEGQVDLFDRINSA